MTHIAAPGIYPAVDIDVYHSQACCDGVSVSSTGLKMMLKPSCPAKFWSQSDMNPNRVPRKEKSVFSFGKAAHALALGEPDFHRSFIISPFDDFKTKDARAWRDEQTRQVLKADDFETVCAMADALRASPQLHGAFSNGRPEVTAIIKDAETGIYLKARPDWYPNDLTTNFIEEFKTTASADEDEFAYGAFDYGYHIQAALCLDVVAGATGEVPLGIAHIIQEKTAPYIAELRMFSNEQLMFGRLLYRRALRVLANCIETGVWPGYTTSPQYINTPYRVMKEMENFSDNNDAGTPADEHSASEYASTL
jgi:PDDEXK-like domain of unknown function (DUF3799)